MTTRNPHLIRNWLMLLCLLVFGLIGGAWWYWQQLHQPMQNESQQRNFIIQKGESGVSVATRLKEQGFIRSDIVFRQVLKSKSQGKSLEPGDYKLSASMTPEQIVETLLKGAIDKWVTLVEGWRVEQLAAQLSTELNIDQQEFITKAKPSEGYLFPDTYLINPDAPVDSVISLLKNTFDKRFDDQLKAAIKAKGLTPEQAVILASLVEREARSDEVRTQVAGIMLRRLNIEMPLQIDATVQYAKDSQTLAAGKTIQKFWQPITQEEYRSVVSDYNTYLNTGLPPGPICSPSLSSLKAVANANPQTPYLFYYHDAQGNTYYAKTLEEHNANVNNN